MPGHAFNFCAGTLCLDFSNTLSDRFTSSPIEHLATYADVVAFVRQAGVATAAEAACLRAVAERRPDDAARVSARARALRETLHRVFAAFAEGSEPQAADLERLSDETAAFAGNRRLRRDGAGYRWVCDPPEDDLAWPLSPIVASAGELLTEGDLGRIRVCEAEDCAWLFYDSSKNHSRRWCDMAECGNRAKARSFYRRRRESV